MAYPVVVSFYTREWEYPAHALRLQAECEKLGIQCVIEERDSTNDYKKNTRIKPFYIREKLQQLAQPVLWLDVDSSLFQLPTELKNFTHDMAAVRMRQDNKLQRQWQVGALAFANKDKIRNFLDLWCAAATSGTDEGAFEAAIKQLTSPLNVLALDRERWYRTIRDENHPPQGAVCGMRIAKSDLKYQTKIKDKAKAGSKAGITELVDWRVRGKLPTFFGSEIACGDTRLVYHDQANPDRIIKHLYHSKGKHNANETEWFVWNAIKSESFSRYFAPCWDISRCGNFLSMTKAPRNSRHFQTMAQSLGSSGDRLDVSLLEEIPDMLKDDIDRMHQWGVLQDSMVIIDYGSAGFLEGLLAFIKSKGSAND